MTSRVWNRKSSRDNLEEKRSIPQRSVSDATGVRASPKKSSSFWSKLSREPPLPSLSVRSSSTSTTLDGSIHSTVRYSELKEENECLKQQVLILQTTLQQKEKQRVEVTLSTWEGTALGDNMSGCPLTPRANRWSQAANPSTPTSATEMETPDAAKPAVEKAIALSLQLAEAQAEIDELKSQLTTSNQKIKDLTAAQQNVKKLLIGTYLPSNPLARTAPAIVETNPVGDSTVSSCSSVGERSSDNEAPIGGESIDKDVVVEEISTDEGIIEEVASEGVEDEGTIEEVVSEGVEDEGIIEEVASEGVEDEGSDEAVDGELDDVSL